MLKKRLAVMIASIATASFILGAMFNLNLITTADDDDRRPVWPTYITGIDPTALPDVWNVTVWPKPKPLGTSVNVWWHKHVNNEIVHSSPYDADEFGQLHVLMVAIGLETTEDVRIYIYGHLWNDTHNEFLQVMAARIDLDEDNEWAGMWIRTCAITIPVPSDTFHFTIDCDYECEVSLSFYLTPA